MENKIYTFDINPLDYQPSGYCDFSKICTPKRATITYTNLFTYEKECHTIKRTEILNDNGIKEFIYIFPHPFIKKDSI